MDQSDRIVYVSAAPASPYSFLFFGAGVLLGWMIWGIGRVATVDRNPGLFGQTKVRARASPVAFKDLQTGDPSDQLVALQEQINDALQLAEQKATASWNQNHNNELLDAANHLSELNIQIQEGFKQDAAALAASDIATLNQLAVTLKTTAEKIPAATATITEINDYLGPVNDVLAVFNAKK